MLMCLAIHGKIVEVLGETALVDFGGIKKKVNITLVPGAGINDYVLVHVGFAIQKVDEKAAKTAIGLLHEYPR